MEQQKNGRGDPALAFTLIISSEFDFSDEERLAAMPVIVQEEINFICLNFSTRYSCKFLSCSTLQSPASPPQYIWGLNCIYGPQKG